MKLADHPVWLRLTAGRHGKDGNETGLPSHVQPQTILLQTAGEQIKDKFPLYNGMALTVGCALMPLESALDNCLQISKAITADGL